MSLDVLVPMLVGVALLGWACGMWTLRRSERWCSSCGRTLECPGCVRATAATRTRNARSKASGRQSGCQGRTRTIATLCGYGRGMWWLGGASCAGGCHESGKANETARPRLMVPVNWPQSHLFLIASQEPVLDSAAAKFELGAGLTARAGVLLTHPVDVAFCRIKLDPHLTRHALHG
jgi:hypothetical protein